AVAAGGAAIVRLLGANGAGKATTLRASSNNVRRTGRIVFAGKSIAGRSPEAIARLGVAHVPEGRGIFGELTVRENMRLGSYMRPHPAGRRGPAGDPRPLPPPPPAPAPPPGAPS